MESSRAPIGLALALAGLALALTLPSLSNGLTWDDADLVNGRARGCRTDLVECLSGRTLEAYYRPVLALSFAVPDKVRGGGAAPVWVYHLENSLLHALATLLLTLLAFALLGRTGGLAAGLLYAVHPLHATAVGWIGGRTDVLAAAAAAGFGVCLLRWARTRAWRDAALTVVAFTVMVGAKEQTLPLGLLVPWVLAVNGRPPRAWLAGTAPFVAIAAAFAWQLSRVADPSISAKPGWPLGTHALVVLQVLGRFWGAALTPTPDALHAFTLPVGTLETVVAIGLALGCGAAVVLALVRGGFAQRFAAAWIVLTVGPVSQVLPLGSFLVAPYRFVLPLLGVCVLGGWGFARLLERRRALALGLGGALSVLLGVLTVTDLGNWGSSELASVAALDASADDLFHRMQVVEALQRRGKLTLGVVLTDAGLTRLTGRADWTVATLGELDRAELRRTLTLVYAPQLGATAEVIVARVFFQRGLLLDELGRFPEALEAFAVGSELDGSQPRFRRRAEQLREALAKGEAPPPMPPP